MTIHIEFCDWVWSVGFAWINKKEFFIYLGPIVLTVYL